MRNATDSMFSNNRKTRQGLCLSALPSFFIELAQSIDKYYAITGGMQKHIDELMPKAQTKKHSYERD